MKVRIRAFTGAADHALAQYKFHSLLLKVRFVRDRYETLRTLCPKRALSMKGPRSTPRRPKQASIQQDSNRKILANHEPKPIRQPALRRAEPTPGDRTASPDSISSARATDHDEDNVAPLHKAPELVANQDQGLAELVWKFFEAEIREALIEVQEALGSGDAVGTRQ